MQDASSNHEQFDYFSISGPEFLPSWHSNLFVNMKICQIIVSI